MAVSLENIESWLPAELPTEEELLLETTTTTTTTTTATTEFDPSCFPTEFPYEFDSASPTETDSSRDDNHDEEDAFLAGLTHRLSEQLAFNPEGGQKKKRQVARSPESTLSGIRSCCWSVSVSSNGSPNGEPSPPTTPFAFQDDDTLDRICAAAAGHVARLKGLLVPEALGRKSLQSPSGFYSAQGFSSNASSVYQKHLGQQQKQVRKPQYSPVWPQPQHQQVKSNWHNQPQKQQQHHQQQQIPFKLPTTSTVFHDMPAEKSLRPLGLPQSAWPSLQSPQNLSNRASYLRDGGGPTHLTIVKRERAGTGVFLPQPKLYFGNNPSINPKISDSSKRKPGCSTVVLPAKVIQALNMNLEDRNVNGLGHDHLRFHPSIGVSDYDLLSARRNAILAQQKRNLLRSERLLNHELRLPVDWTY